MSKIEQSAKYFTDIADVERKLSEVYRKVLLEEYVPSNNVVAKCFINGAYYYSKGSTVEVETLRKFKDLLRACSRERREVVLSNLLNRLDTITRYKDETPFDDDIPF